MNSAKKTDKQQIIDLLSAAFDENQSVNFIVKQDGQRRKRIRALMDYSFEVCYRSGEVWLSEGRMGCALVLYPHQKRSTLQTVWLDIKLIFQAIGIGGIFKAMKREALIKEKQPKEPMAYLWFIGVNPFYPHRQTGSKNPPLRRTVRRDMPRVRKGKRRRK